MDGGESLEVRAGVAPQRLDGRAGLAAAAEEVRSRGGEDLGGTASEGFATGSLQGGDVTLAGARCCGLHAVADFSPDGGILRRLTGLFFGLGLRGIGGGCGFAHDCAVARQFVEADGGDAMLL